MLYLWKNFNYILVIYLSFYYYEISHNLFYQKITLFNLKINLSVISKETRYLRTVFGLLSKILQFDFWVGTLSDVKFF